MKEFEAIAKQATLAYFNSDHSKSLTEFILEAMRKAVQFMEDDFSRLPLIKAGARTIGEDAVGILK